MKNGEKKYFTHPYCKHWPQRASQPNEWWKTPMFVCNRRFFALQSRVSTYINWCYSYYWSHVYFHNFFWDSSNACLWSKNFLIENWLLYFPSGTWQNSCSRLKWSPWTNGKVEIQNKHHFSWYFRCYLSEAGKNWAKLACQFAFAHNTSLNSNTGTTPYEIDFGFKPQIPVSPKLGLVRDDNDLRHFEFCQSLPNHTHVIKETSHSCIDNLLSSRSSIVLLNRESQFKNNYRKIYRQVREANKRFLSYRNNYKLSKPLRVGQEFLLENHNVAFRKKSARTLKWTVHCD